MPMTLQEVLLTIRGAIGRGKGTFGLAPASPGQSKPFSLAAGSVNAVRVEGGFIVVLGLSHDQVVTLREMCDELLGTGAAS